MLGHSYLENKGMSSSAMVINAVLSHLLLFTSSVIQQLENSLCSKAFKTLQQRVLIEQSPTRKNNKLTKLNNQGGLLLWEINTREAINKCELIILDRMLRMIMVALFISVHDMNHEGTQRTLPCPITICSFTYVRTYLIRANEHLPVQVPICSCTSLVI